MYRYAIKGLSGDEIQTFTSKSPSSKQSINNHYPLVLKPNESFPDDRRFALLKINENGGKNEALSRFDPNHPKWLHKENFLCAFSAPALMSTFDTEYKVYYPEDNPDFIIRQFTIWKRDMKQPRSECLLGPLNLSNVDDCQRVSNFFSNAYGKSVQLVSAFHQNNEEHLHQFGNTRSGVKKRNDTRTIHIVNAATIRQVSDAIGISLSPLRFRPNIVVDGLEPWQEFEAVGKSIQSIADENDNENNDSLILDVISKTVRCEGISMDPLYNKDEHNGKDQEPLDIPKLLQQYFPQHGPYLGVYAVVREGGTICEGDTMKIVD